MAKVNTNVYVHTDTGTVFIPAGSEVPKGVEISNESVLADEAPRADLSPSIGAQPILTPLPGDPVPGPSQTVAFDPESDEAKSKAVGDSSDRLDDMSHAELDDYADSNDIDLSNLGTKPSRAEKIEAVRAAMNARGTAA